MKQIGEFLDMAGIDPLRWARFPVSQHALNALFAEAREREDFAAIRDQHIADGVCTEDGRALKMWSVAACEFVAPPWYVRANHELAA